MSRTKDFDRFVAACDYPGEVYPDLVVGYLADYLKALGIELRIVRIEQGWQLQDHPSLMRQVELILDDLLKRRPDLRDARAARDAREPLT